MKKNLYWLTLLKIVWKIRKSSSFNLSSRIQKLIELSGKMNLLRYKIVWMERKNKNRNKKHITLILHLRKNSYQ